MGNTQLLLQGEETLPHGLLVQPDALLLLRCIKAPISDVSEALCKCRSLTTRPKKYDCLVENFLSPCVVLGQQSFPWSAKPLACNIHTHFGRTVNHTEWDARKNQIENVLIGSKKLLSWQQ